MIMMGYDRPLKPEWIYKTLKNIKVGIKPEEFYDAYNEIAVELTGKDGGPLGVKFEGMDEAGLNS